MKLRHLSIKNFRGIQELDWNISGDVVCLIGPGDSTKTSILLAVEYLFSPTWNLSLSDTDFYLKDVSQSIEISCVISSLPEGLIGEDKFGLQLGFWNPDDKTISQKQENEKCEMALRVKLEVGRDLEPKWSVISLQNDLDIHSLSTSDRRLLGVAKIGNFVESDLAWGRNSSLARLSVKDDLSKIPALLTEAERKVIEILKDENLGDYDETIKKVRETSQSLGIDAKQNFRVGLDPARFNLNQGAIALFDGDLPFSIRGNGSRRLLSMAISKASISDGVVLLIDEIENSLEPFRLRHLIRQIRPRDGDRHQVFFTTHSSIAVEECKAHELYIVRSLNGKTTVLEVEPEFQKVVRSSSEAFLARKIIVCEGKTEEGLLIGLDQNFWSVKHQNTPALYKFVNMAEAGSVPILGGGDESPCKAQEFGKLGFDVLFFGDSDKVDKLKPSVDELTQQKILVVLCKPEGDKGLFIEQRLCLDLSIEGLEKYVGLACELSEDPPNIWDSIYQACPHNTLRKSRDFRDLLSDIGEDSLRQVIGEISGKGPKGWFKRRDKGEKLGELLSKFLPLMDSQKPTALMLSELEKWCYE